MAAREMPVRFGSIAHRVIDEPGGEDPSVDPSFVSVACNLGFIAGKADVGLEDPADCLGLPRDNLMTPGPQVVVRSAELFGPLWIVIPAKMSSRMPPMAGTEFGGQLTVCGHAGYVEVE